mmetsp:Transcript_16102/g.36084  ORF Transcript_16102/g.36084 Transcript_16102/m.36084 type:complete len:249 (+) Transcript_16102:360-1106(+)
MSLPAHLPQRWDPWPVGNVHTVKVRRCGRFAKSIFTTQMLSAVVARTAPRLMTQLGWMLPSGWSLFGTMCWTRQQGMAVRCSTCVATAAAMASTPPLSCVTRGRHESASLTWLSSMLELMGRAMASHMRFMSAACARPPATCRHKRGRVPCYSSVTLRLVTRAAMSGATCHHSPLSRLQRHTSARVTRRVGAHTIGGSSSSAIRWRLPYSRLRASKCWMCTLQLACEPTPISRRIVCTTASQARRCTG